MKALLVATLLFLSQFCQVEACTRALYSGDEGIVITGRTLDWMEDMHSNLWIFPRGLQRSGVAGPNSFTWTSKYGSVIVSGYEAGTADGMNEKGVVANALYLAESQYPSTQENKPLMSIAAWAQYALDSFATVAEGVDLLSKEPFVIVAPILPNGSGAQLHLALSDPSGDSAIFEYINGNLIIHHGKEYNVMTNSPTYDQQLAINSYWQSVGGLTFLPGTNRAADRFVRASFFIGAVPKKVDPKVITAVPNGTFENQALASVLSIMRSVSVPLGISDPTLPNIASTLWRTVADQKNTKYYFDSATVPNVFWVALAEIDFKEGSPVKKLTVANGNIYSGNATSQFISAEPFAFLPWTR
jgi:choloylglycine hydrolase